MRLIASYMAHREDRNRLSGSIFRSFVLECREAFALRLKTFDAWKKLMT